MEYITAINENKTLYIEKDKVAAILAQPRIQRVPGAGTNIRGISLYDGQIVVYYRLGNGEGCGIIIKTDGESLMGITAEYPSQEDIEPGALTAVMPGIWEIKSD